MLNYNIDYSKLENKIYKKAYRFEDVKDKLETVAWDICRFKDGDQAADLWQVQSSDDGDYIVALYDQEEDKKTASPWDVSINKTAGRLQFSYKGDPLVSIQADKLGIQHSELSKVKNYLPEKLASNKKLVKALLNELSSESKSAVFLKYPELV